MKNGYTFSGGPWKIQKWERRTRSPWCRTRSTGATKPKLDKVIFKIQADTSAEFTAFKSDQVSMIYPQPQLDAVDQINAGLPNTPEGHLVRHRQLRVAVDQQWQGAVQRARPSVRRWRTPSTARRSVERLFGKLGVTEPLQVRERADRVRLLRHAGVRQVRAEPGQGRRADDRRRLGEGLRRHLRQGRQEADLHGQRHRRQQAP